ncbi:murein L,D-transpeptidase [Massilia glaciei]|uniref:Murein L,D-transpeptidase n=1 Tax=Massilia glaciei TaxID=1524097 RepID=A0A2U2HPM3_9BURK|nr:murein L,D-transpeptidase [Massilia glaciei]
MAQPPAAAPAPGDTAATTAATAATTTTTTSTTPKAAKNAKAAVTLDAATVNAPGAPAVAPARADAASVLRAQILLNRARFSSGEIDAAFGSNVRQALSGYQRKMGLPATGVADAATWAALNAGAAAALVTYTITDADVAGPFVAIPQKMADKAKLSALGYSSVEEALGEKFHASPALLQRLNPGKNFSRAGEQIIVPNVLDTEPLPKASQIVVDKTDRTLTLMDGDGKPMAQFPVTTGSKHDPLPLGKWKVNGISKAPVFHYNPALFWDATAGDKKAKIPAGPNNPVGVAWVDLSKPHYGIHGTPVPASIGKTESHGCIRMTNWDVTTMMQSVGSGTAVLLKE